MNAFHNSHNDRYSAFIKANQEMWNKIPTRDGCNGLLLVAPDRHPILSHANAVFARIIGEARGLSIGWMDGGDPDFQERLLSYDPASRIIPRVEFTRSEKLYIWSRFASVAPKMILTGDILSLSLDGILFGDILYDSYLASHKVATIPSVNKSLLRMLLELIKIYHGAKKTLHHFKPSALLLAHGIGLGEGPLCRAALASGVEVYQRCGGIGIVTCRRMTALKDVYSYPMKPTRGDFHNLLTMERRAIEGQFDALIEERMELDRDEAGAYRHDKSTYTSREEFAGKFKLDHKKKNVFVMLHAFNDHPHSHFEWMLFRDYYDWFAKTLSFAREKSDVNWIFKEHPASKYYPTQDISLPDHFENCPDHVVFLDAEASFNSQSLLYLADAVITTLGTAGIEFPATGGIPSIVGGDCAYSGFGFTIEPRSQDEYFRVLSDIQNIGRLTAEQQYAAKLVFLYMQNYCHPPFDWGPVVAYDETQCSADLDTYYWDLVIRRYREKPDVLIQQFKDYVRRIAQADFSRLLTLPQNGSEAGTEVTEERMP